jgi:HPt (histidine-containing phosphotransfer) domain-containing protein
MATLDPAIFRQLQETTSTDFARELVDTFLEDAPQMLGELHSAWQAQSADRFRRAAHSLKSNALTFGAADLAIRARDLENAGLPADAAPLQALQGSYEAAAAALLQIVRA